MMRKALAIAVLLAPCVWSDPDPGPLCFVRPGSPPPSVPLLAGCSKLTAPPVEPIVSEAGASTGPASASVAVRVPQPPPAPVPPPEVAGDPETELKIEDQIVGKGPAVKVGDSVLVHYTGKLRNGTKFDASLDHPDKKPLPVVVGTGTIEGFGKGLVGMKLGGKRKLTIPWPMAYGAEGRPPIIPPKSTLVFDLELVELKAAH